MVDRAALIKRLEPRVRPSGTQAVAIRAALDKALTEMVLSLPLNEATSLEPSDRSELELVLQSIDNKLIEKLALSWEPSRKLDADTKPTTKRELIELLHGRRPAYAPITQTLDTARSGNVAVVKLTMERLVPTKELKSLLGRWDKNFKPAATNREAYIRRLLALLEGAPLAEKPAARRQK